MGKKLRHYKQSLSKFKNKTVLFLLVLFLLTSLVLLYSVFSDEIGSLNLWKSGNSEDQYLFPIEASFILPELSLDVKETTLEIVMGDSESKIYLGDLDFNNLEGTKITLTEYTGSIIVDGGGELSLDGIVKNFLINNIDVNKEDKQVEVLAEKLNLGSLRIAELSLKSFSFVSLGGVALGEGRVLGDGNQKAEISLRPFNGAIEVDENNFILKGETKKFLIEGIPAGDEGE